MSKFITLAADQPSGVTVISNIFIDHYLPQANGEFVKIYIYMLRWLSTRKHRPFSIECIADTLNMTENDVLRALKYWEQQHLLLLSWEDNDLTGIQLLLSVFHPVMETPEPEPAAEPEPEPAKPAIPEKAADPIQEEAPKAYSMQEISGFTEGADGQELLFIIQQYLGHPLSPGDVNVVYYMYDGLGFSTELIEYLFEYCVSGGHTHMRYIEKVALNWSQQQIKTVEEARMQTESYNQVVFSVMKAYGLGNRMPTPGETEFITKWEKTYGFSQELILEACKRTMMSVHTPSFDYTDKILSNWKASGVFSMRDVEAADKVFNENKQAASRPQAPAKAKPAGNRFHNFHQRTYDYEDLEKKLSMKLQKNAQAGEN